MPARRWALRAARGALAIAGLAALLACGLGAGSDRDDRSGAETLRVQIAGEPFELELALDPETRYRGLGGRASIEPNGGMLFVFPGPVPQRFVMRDCLVAIDIAFLDAGGRVVAIHEMQTEPPQRPGESDAAYEARLRVYRSVFPAQFAVETAGGRLRDIGLVVGQRIALDTSRLELRAR